MKINDDFFLFFVKKQFYTVKWKNRKVELGMKLWQKKYSHCFIIFLVFLFIISLTACSVQNTFTPPIHPLTDKTAKRLTLFKASQIVGERPKKDWANHNTILMAIPEDGKKMVDLRWSRNNDFMTYSWEWKPQDTGTITFVMAMRNGNRLMNKRLFTDTTINLSDLKPGDNFWHLNYYTERINDRGRIPVLSLREIVINDDYFISVRSIRFRHYLTYNVSSDSTEYVKNKRIISRQRTFQRRYYNVRTIFKPVSFWLSAQK